MARLSTLKSMRALSTVLSLAVVSLVAAGANDIRSGHSLAGTELIGWAFVPLALLLGFTAPTRCKVIRTNRKACGKWAYGYVFGCTDVTGHCSGKFIYRLGLRRGEVEAVAPKPKDGYVMYQPGPSERRSDKVKVEESALAKCGFWVGFISGIIGIIQAVASFVH